VIVPLVVHGRSIGALAVASVNPHQYSEYDAAFFQEVANQVALAIENMTAHEEIAALKAILERESVYLREEIHREHNFDEIVGSSAPLRALLRQVDQVAPTDSTVLIIGETGTGKELIARAIHSRSPRRERPLVKVNCSAISAGLVESELFGHVKGAFTGAIDRRVGRFELAHRGTIFLDEVGDLTLETQVKLLRVLQEREFEPVGSSKTQPVNVRVIAATNRDLQEAVRGGHFRSDLFYRLNVFPLQVPALRERRDLLVGFHVLDGQRDLVGDFLEEGGVGFRILMWIDAGYCQGADAPPVDHERDDDIGAYAVAVGPLLHREFALCAEVSAKEQVLLAKDATHMAIIGRHLEAEHEVTRWQGALEREQAQYIAPGVVKKDGRPIKGHHTSNSFGNGAEQGIPG